VTLEDIAKARGLSIHTVRFDRGNNPSWPEPVGRRAGGRGRPALVYDRAAIDAFYLQKAASSPQARAGPRNPRGTWPAEGRVDDREAASRLGVEYPTMRSYPAVYRRSANHFPVKGPDGKYRWGDLEDWDAGRQGSGRRGRRAETLPRRPRLAGSDAAVQTSAAGRPTSIPRTAYVARDHLWCSSGPTR
jgi:hypothetical protein